MRDVDAKKEGTEVLLEEMGVQRSEAEAQQVPTRGLGTGVTMTNASHSSTQQEMRYGYGGDKSGRGFERSMAGTSMLFMWE